MTSLPIVERELRISSRKRMTYWARVAGAGGLLVVFGLMFTVTEIGRGTGISMGQIIFSVLKWISYIFAATMVFAASDSLSEEKREGTLGLLFLTDLKGYDVVFGKLISMSLQAFYALLAGMPVLALPLMMGGVTGVEFARTLLVIFNMMFFSLAVGLFVSSMSREVLKAMNMGAILSLLFIAGLPWIDWCIARYDASRWKPLFSIASPGYLFIVAPRARANIFWESLGIQHAIAWVFLIAACVIVPRAWQERNNEKTGWWSNFSARWRFGGKRWRLAFRRKWMGRDPILWLALRDRWLPRFALAVTVLVLFLVSLNIYINSSNQPLQSLSGFTFLLSLGVTLWLASQATRFYVEAVRSGAMELMLVTPVPSSQIVRSQWTALWRTFLVPVLLLLAFKVTTDVNSIMMMKKFYVKAKSTPGFQFDFVTQQMVQMAGNILNFVLWLSALGWFGMWMGLTTRKVSFAIVKSIALVCLIPWFIELFIMAWGMMMTAYLKVPSWYGMLPSIAIEMAKNIFFIALSRKKLMGNFREIVVSRSSQEKIKTPAYPPPVPAMPRPLVT